jgi:hypothetical protein
MPHTRLSPLSAKASAIAATNFRDAYLNLIASYSDTALKDLLTRWGYMTLEAFRIGYATFTSFRMVVREAPTRMMAISATP